MTKSKNCIALYPVESIISDLSVTGIDYVDTFLDVDSRFINQFLQSHEQRLFDIIDQLASKSTSPARSEYIWSLYDTDKLLLRISLLIADMQHDVRYHTISYTSKADLNEKFCLFLKQSYIECRDYHAQTKMDLGENIKQHICLRMPLF